MMHMTKCDMVGQGSQPQSESDLLPTNVWAVKPSVQGRKEAVALLSSPDGVPRNLCVSKEPMLHRVYVQLDIEATRHRLFQQAQIARPSIGTTEQSRCLLPALNGGLHYPHVRGEQIRLRLWLGSLTHHVALGHMHHLVKERIINNIDGRIYLYSKL